LTTRFGGSALTGKAKTNATAAAKANELRGLLFFMEKRVNGSWGLFLAFLPLE
jgi:hypothetical protein